MNSITLSPLNSSNVQFTKSGLYIQPGIEYHEWQDIGVVLQFLASCIQFALGDWINYGERAYGEKYAQAVTETPYAYGTLRNYAYVAGNIELSRRNDRLSFAHHSEVAKLVTAKQDYYLALAEQREMSVRELRREISASVGGDEGSHICPVCGYDMRGK